MFVKNGIVKCVLVLRRCGGWRTFMPTTLSLLPEPASVALHAGAACVDELDNSAAGSDGLFLPTALPSACKARFSWRRCYGNVKTSLQTRASALFLHRTKSELDGSVTTTIFGETMATYTSSKVKSLVTVHSVRSANARLMEAG